MKITIEVDCTPEEARRAMGMPDLSPLHEHFVDRMREGMDKMTPGPEMLGSMMRGWSSAGENSADFWRKLFTSSDRVPPA